MIEFTAQDSHDLPTVAEFRRTEYGRVFLGIVQRSHDAKDRALKLRPQVNDEDIRKDWRYQMGYIEALHDILEMPAEATVILQKIE